MVRDALNFIQRYGPWTGQERWEENFGISPSTFSAATAALLMGAEIFSEDSYKNTANTWLKKNNDNIHTWAFTHNGHYGDGRYYIRIAGCSHTTAVWNPNNRSNCKIANSGQTVEQTQLLDQGFLKLALFGLVSASEKKLKTSLEKINRHLRVKTPTGIGWYRYSFDAYGENNKGRLWPLLGGEHGRYAIERHRQNDLSNLKMLEIVSKIKKSFEGFANAGDMIPEQVFEQTGEGTGSATPLAWSHAEYIKLLWSLEKEKNISNAFVK